MNYKSFTVTLNAYQLKLLDSFNSYYCWNLSRYFFLYEEEVKRGCRLPAMRGRHLLLLSCF